MRVALQSAPKARNMIARGKREAQRSASPLDRVKQQASSPEKGEIKFPREGKRLICCRRFTNLTIGKRDQDMPQSLSSILIHLIFSTKNREPFLTPEIDSELYPYIASIFKAMKSPALIINGTTDHLHTLFSLSRVITIADLVEEVKTESSKWIKTKGREFRNFHWQSGYGAFSISQSQVATVKRYIGRQKEHHRRVTFQDEYRKFLKAYEVEYDERFV
jgi:REP-associated tyrosine transposase